VAGHFRLATGSRRLLPSRRWFGSRTRNGFDLDLFEGVRVGFDRERIPVSVYLRRVVWNPNLVALAVRGLDDGGIFAFGVSDAGSRQAEEEDYDEMRVFWFHSLVCVGFY